MDGTTKRAGRTAREQPQRTMRIAIVGAGPAGLAMAIRLREAGHEAITIFEKNDGVGGTWRENTYPGSGCDIPSLLYCFSFARKTDWTRAFAEQPEILAYFESLVDRFDLARHLRFRTEIRTATWDETRALWVLETATGERHEAEILVSALGQLNRPHVPRFDGAFDGPSFHSARFRHDVDLRGKRIAIVGTGASAVQIVPRLAPEAKELVVFQRTPGWVVPKPDIEYGPWWQRLFRYLPFAALWLRLYIFLFLEIRFAGFHERGVVARLMEWQSRLHLFLQVRDPILRARLRPTERLGCKRILISDEWYPALCRSNVRTETNALARLESGGLRTVDGTLHEVDAIVYATGFRATEFLAPIAIHGRDGVALDDAWRAGAEAYAGLAIPGFPNLFLLYGPNTNLGHNSILYMIEQQVGFVVRSLDELASRDASSIEVRREAARAFDETLRRDLARSVWGAGCTSWYKDASGKITNNWSGSAHAYARRVRQVSFGDFLFDQAVRTRSNARTSSEASTAAASDASS